MSVACHYSDGTTVIAENVDYCPAFRDDTGGELIGVEMVYPSDAEIDLSVSAPKWPVSLGWWLLIAAIVYEKARKH